MADSAYFYNQLFLESLVYPFKTVHVYYSHIEDMHVEVKWWKKIFLIKGYVHLEAISAPYEVKNKLLFTSFFLLVY